MSFFKNFIETKEEQNNLHHGEIFEIWAHLVSRYDVLKKTRIFANYAHDPDLKMLLDEGIKVLEQQIEKLEEIMTQNNIPLPDRPPAKANSESNDPLITDQMIYREVLNGMGQFLNTHIRTYRFMWNDDLRQTFIDFFVKELEVYDDWMKYGKMKGWINTPPEPDQ